MLILSQYTSGNANTVRSNGRRAHAAKAGGVPTPAGTRLQMERSRWDITYKGARRDLLRRPCRRGKEEKGIKRAVEKAAEDERIFIPSRASGWQIW
jgi:hypothetical protein